MTARVARRIDALHGEAGQILHGVPSVGHCFRSLPNGKALAPLMAADAKQQNDGPDFACALVWCQEQFIQHMVATLPRRELDIVVWFPDRGE
jgi:hypothetical protein